MVALLWDGSLALWRNELFPALFWDGSLALLRNELFPALLWDVHV